MATKAIDQISIIDVTDAYSVILTSESYTFLGGINSAKSGSCTTKIIAMRGSEIIPATITLSEIKSPSGITVTKDSNAETPTLTVSISSSVTNAGEIDIPVKLEDGSITINKKFSYAIAFTGATGASGKGIRSTVTTYQTSTSGSVQPTGTWQEIMPQVEDGQYLWTKTVITYTDNSTSESYTISKVGKDGIDGSNGVDGKGIVSITNYYLATSSGSKVTADTSGWTTTIQQMTATNKYLWNYETTSYTKGSPTSTTPHIIGVYGKDGTDGTDGISITSIEEHYGLSTSSTTEPTTWSTTVPKLTATDKYLWNYEVINYSKGNPKTTDKMIIGVYGDKGEKGQDGTDAITLVITSSAGTIFKNSTIITTLTAHIYKGGKELSSTEIGNIGTVKWYKDNSTTAIGTGLTLSITAGDVVNKATFSAMLEN